MKDTQKIPGFIFLVVGALILPIFVLGLLFGTTNHNMPMRLTYCGGYALYFVMSYLGLKRPQLLFGTLASVAIMVVALWLDGSLWQDHTMPPEVPPEGVTPHAADTLR